MYPFTMGVFVGVSRFADNRTLYNRITPAERYLLFEQLRKYRLIMRPEGAYRGRDIFSREIEYFHEGIMHSRRGRVVLYGLAMRVLCNQ